MSHSPCSPDFVPCDFFLYPKLSVALQRSFNNKGDATEIMLILTANPKE
jgi:hypothetical protein